MSAAPDQLTAMMVAMADEAERFLRFINPTGNMLELRVLIPGEGMCSGRYNDTHKMARHAASLQMRHGAPSIWYSLNSLKPEATHVGADRPNTVRVPARRGHSGGKKDAARRDTYLIDCDPVRPSDTMATDEQCAAAANTAEQVRDYLTGLGWPEPIVLFSGNGTHLLYKGDGCGPESKYWNHVLKHLNSKFGGPAVKIDPGMGNPDRVSRLPGCYNRKGGGEGRMARVISYPAKWEPVSHGPHVYKLAVSTGYDEKPTRGKKANGRADDERPELLADEDDVLQIIKEFPEHLHLSHIDYRDDGCTYFILDECPFVGRRHRGDPNKSALILGEETLGYKCMSDDCEGRGWSDLRRWLFELTGRFPSVQVYERREYEITDEDAQAWGFADVGEMSAICSADVYPQERYLTADEFSAMFER